MPENEVPLEELRAAVLEPQDETAELVTAAFREGMSAGLDFAYRVTDDFRNTLPSASARGLIDRVLEVLVSEHDMRAGQPIRAIQVERAGIQAADAMLTGLSEALMTVQPTPDPGPTEMNLADNDPVCDGPCCRPEDDPDNVFNWVNADPAHDPGPVTIGPDPTRCTCGRFWLNDPRGTVVAPSPGGAIRHRASGPCFLVVVDPEPEEEQVFDLEHSCDCGAIPGLVGGMVPEGREDGTVIVHRPEGEPCTLGIDS